MIIDGGSPSIRMSHRACLRLPAGGAPTNRIMPTDQLEDMVLEAEKESTLVFQGGVETVKRLELATYLACMLPLAGR